MDNLKNKKSGIFGFLVPYLLMAVAIIAFILFANVWFYWILLGEPNGEIGKTLHTVSTVAVLVSLYIMPSYLAITYGVFLILLIILRVKKIEKATIRRSIASFLPTQTIIFTSLLGSLVVFLTFGIGMISEVSAEINNSKQISGTGLVTGNELILVNSLKTVVSFYPRSEVTRLTIQTQRPNWALTPIASLWVESIIKK